VDAAVIEVRQPDRPALRVRVHSTLDVGRDTDGLVVDDPRASRLHCRLTPTPDGLEVVDMGSTNGTLLNGAAIAGPVTIQAGDVVQVGDTTLRLVDAPAHAARSAAGQATRTLDGPVRRPDGATGPTVTIVMTDIVDSTALAHRLGDRAWFEVIQEHTRLVRRLAAVHSGTIVKPLGDGFMLTFPTARGAVRFGIALQRALAGSEAGSADGSPVRVRIGMHTGEGIAEGGDLYGTHVNLAARIAGSAEGDQILVSALVRQLAESDGSLGFGAVHRMRFKGLPDAFEVCEVSWGSAPPTAGSGEGHSGEGHATST
jgi:class 3 adenylate cyclase